MARIRTIKPEFAESQSMGRLSRDARLLFVLMWTIADDVGRLRGAPRYIASRAFPYDEDAADLVDAWMDELEREGCIRRYTVGDSEYIEIPNWGRHQLVSKPTPSRLPDPPGTREASPQSDDSDGESGEARGNPGNPPPRARAQDLGPRTVDLVPSTETTTADKSAWDGLLDAIGETYGGIDTRTKGGKPYAWAGRIVGVVGKHAHDDPAAAVRLWRSWVASIEDRRYMPGKDKAAERFGVWAAGRNGSGPKTWKPDGYDDA